MDTSRQGICHICGKNSKLTFEHVPPLSTFNDKKIKSVSGEQLFSTKNRPWDTSGMTYTLQQRGAGFFSLCESCNNNTGCWYGKEYTKFVWSIGKLMYDREEDFIVNEFTHLQLYKVNPLAIIKQMLSMFCSINKDYFIDDNLREFILNKTSKELDKKKYRLCMYLTKDLCIRYAGLTWLFNLENSDSIAVSEISAYPIGLILYLNPENTHVSHGYDITDFANCEYNTEYNIDFSLPLYERNSFFPLDYRTKEDIEDCIRKKKT